MSAFMYYLAIQFKMDLRNKGTLLTFYLTPLIFFFVMGSVFSATTPLLRTTLAASMTIFAVTMGAIMGAPTPIVKMRESGTLRAFKVNGIPNASTLAVSAVSAFMHLFLVSAIIYAVSPLIFQSEIPPNPGLYFGVLALFLLASISIGMLIGVYAQSQSLATVLSMLVFLPSLLLSGIMFPSSMPPPALVWVGRVFPATYALQSFYGYAYRTATSIDAGVSLGVVVVIGLLGFFLATWRFNAVSKSEQM